MMDIHKETINMQPCDQYQRVLETENKVNSLKEDMTEIKQCVNSISASMNSMMQTVQTVVLKLEERDRNSTENTLQNRETFARFGTKMDSLDTCIRAVELDLAKGSKLELKVDTLSKVVYGAGSALFIVMASSIAWLFQKVIS